MTEAAYANVRLILGWLIGIGAFCFVMAMWGCDFIQDFFDKHKHWGMSDEDYEASCKEQRARELRQQRQREMKKAALERELRDKEIETTYMGKDIITHTIATYQTAIEETFGNIKPSVEEVMPGIKVKKKKR